MATSYKNKIYTTLGTPTVAPGNGAFVTNSAGVPAKDYAVKGRTIVWNQIVKNGNFVDEIEWVTDSGTGSVSNNKYTFTATGTQTYGSIKQYMDNSFFIADHKYYVTATITPQYNTGKVTVALHNGRGQLTLWTALASSGKTNFASIIFTISDAFVSNLTESIRLILYCPQTESAQGDVTVISNVWMVDLTQMFGSGNEPTTPAEFRAMFPDDYYPYNAGELKTIAPTSIQASGVERFQILDKSKYPATTTKNGITFTNNGDGTVAANGTATGETNFILLSSYLSSGTHKYLLSGCPSGGTTATYFMSGISGRDYGTGAILSGTGTASNIVCTIANGATASNITFKPQLFDLTEMFGAGNEPATPAEFWQRVPEKLYEYNPSAYKSVNIPSSKYFPDGMRSAGSAYDEINFLSQKAIKRVGIIDLGTLEWSRAESRKTFQTYDLNNFIKWPIGPNYKANTLCPKYTAVSYSVGWNDISVDKICGATWESGGHWFYVRDTAYTDAAAFKAAMSGVMLYYELATPVETAITPPLQALSTYKGFTSFSAPNSLTQNGPLSVTYYAEGGSNPEKGWLTSYKRKLYMGRNIEWNQQRPTSTISGSGLTQSLYGNIGVVSTNVIYEHKYYVSLYIKYAIGNTNTSSMVFKMGNFGKDEFVINMKPTESWNRYEKIETLKSLSTPSYLSGFMKLSPTEQTLSIEWKDVQIFDLTQMFGAGNEPATPAEFWSYFENKLYPYNTGETQPLFKISRKSRYRETV